MHEYPGTRAPGSRGKVTVPGERRGQRGANPVSWRGSNSQVDRHLRCLAAASPSQHREEVAAWTARRPGKGDRSGRLGESPGPSLPAVVGDPSDDNLASGDSEDDLTLAADSRHAGDLHESDDRGRWCRAGLTGIVTESIAVCPCRLGSDPNRGLPRSIRCPFDEPSPLPDGVATPEHAPACRDVHDLAKGICDLERESRGRPTTA